MIDTYHFPYDDWPDDWPVYDDSEDYCGPEGSWISKFIPRDVHGIDCNRCYWAHDNRYTLGKTRKDKQSADKQMLRDQFIAVKAAVAWWRPLRYVALASAYRRYNMVSWFGGKAFDNKGD